MCKGPIGKLLGDRVLLIIVAVIVSAGLLATIFFLEDYVALSRGWVIFILFSMLYIIIVTRTSLPYLKRTSKKTLAALLLIAIQFCVITAFFLLFYFGTIELPRRGILPWGIGVGILAAITVAVFQALAQRA